MCSDGKTIRHVMFDEELCSTIAVRKLCALNYVSKQQDHGQWFISKPLNMILLFCLRYCRLIARWLAPIWYDMILSV